MTNQIIITQIAKQDIGDILTYTIAKWGKEQQNKYKDIIIKSFDNIANNPQIGYIRSDIPPKYRAYNFQKHVIIYTQKNDAIFVARILHANMDFTNKIN